jgi:predicted ribonuclease toxin of YeeF-YezG toxin-antitoxin module
LSVAKNFGTGLYDAGKGAVTGVVNMVAHPVETAKNIGNAVANPKETAKAIWNGVSTAYKEEVINGDANSSAQFAGKAIGEVALAVVGTKGLDKAVKVAKGADAAATANTANKVASTATNVAETTAKKAVKVYNDVKNLAKNATPTSAASTAANAAGKTTATTTNAASKTANPATNVVETVNKGTGKAAIEGTGKTFKPSENGYFGSIGQSGNSKVRNMTGGNSTVTEFYDSISKGYTKETVYPNGAKVRTMPDGTEITYRAKSSSDGTPAVDINKGSTYKPQKIHFID